MGHRSPVGRGLASGLFPVALLRRLLARLDPGRGGIGATRQMWTAAVTFCAHSKSTLPVQRRLTWPKLCEALTTFRTPHPDKGMNPAWSPASYPPGTEQRLSANVVALSCLALDFDTGVGVDAARAPWMDWPHIVHTSYSHTEAVPKFRLVIPLASPVLRGGWPRAWEWAVTRAGLAPDPKCKDPNRIYYLPVARGPYWSLVHEADGGPMLEIDAAALSPTRAEREEAERKSRPPMRSSRPVTVSDALKESAEARALAGQLVGAKVGATRCDYAPCPKCQRPSVWWWIEPGKAQQAQCSHKNSCGWHGWIDQLLPEEA